MTDTFTWRVHATASGGGDLNVAKAQFGDGYAQIAVIGLNPDRQKWDVTVSGFRDDLVGSGKPLDFIKEHAGQSFFWTPPLGEEGLYVCNAYRPQDQGGGYFTLALTFEETFAP